MLRLCIFFLVLCGGFSGSLQAMTLAEAFDLATRYDPAIPQSLAIYEADRTLSDQSLGDRRLSAGVQGSVAQGNSRVTSNLFPAGEDNGIRHQFSAEIRQPLFRRNWRAMGAFGEALDEQAEIGKEDRIQRLLLRVAERYFAVMQALESMEVARLELDALEKALQDTGNRHQAGLVAVTDLQEARARFDLSKAALLRTQTSLASARDALHEITRNGNALMPRLVEDAELPPMVPDSADAWVALAKEHSFPIRRSRQNLAAADAQLKAARAAYSIRLDAVAQYGYDDTTDFHDGQRRRDALVGLEVNVPLYQGGVLRAQKREAHFRLDAANAEVDRLNMETERRIRQLFGEVIADSEQIIALRQALHSAVSARQATENGYKAGARTILDVLDAEARVADARRNMTQARFGILLSLLNLRYEAGILKAEDILRLDQLLAYR